MVASTMLEAIPSRAPSSAPSNTEPTAVIPTTPVSFAIRHRIPAGWYPDREDPARRRWWDGTIWTDFYAVPTIAQTAEVRQTISTPRHSTATGPSPLFSGSTLDANRGSTRPVPALVFVLLVALTGANSVLLSLLALTR
ncbi:MAG: DUF2510 domain-containing protein [Lacisediminihabitans sp.]